MPDQQPEPFIVPQIVVQAPVRAGLTVRAKIGVTAALLYVTASLVVMTGFYNSLNDTCVQRAKARTAIVAILTNDPDIDANENAFILRALPELNC